MSEHKIASSCTNEGCQYFSLEETDATNCVHHSRHCFDLCESYSNKNTVLMDRVMFMELYTSVILFNKELADRMMKLV